MSGLAAPTSVGDLPPQARGVEHVGLVHGRDLLAPAAGEAERELQDATDLVVVILHRVGHLDVAAGQLLARLLSRNTRRRSARESRARPRRRASRALSGDASMSDGWTLTGRRLAKTPSPLRSASSPCSGRTLLAGLSYFGAPTAPSSTASHDWQAASAASVSAVP